MFLKPLKIDPATERSRVARLIHYAGRVAEWFRVLDLKCGGPRLGSNPPPYRYLDLLLIAPSSTPRQLCK